jgi:hypothetical protein
MDMAVLKEVANNTFNVVREVGSWFGIGKSPDAETDHSPKGP